MLINYHTHHERCGHAVGNMRQYVEYAIENGINQIGLSDHMPVIHVPKHKLLPGLGMNIEELEIYVKEALDLRSEYKDDIKVKVGLEADYIEGYEEKIDRLLSPYPFDYIIGSVHFLGEWDLSDSRQMDEWSKRGVDQIYKEYYTAIQNAAASGLYDIIGHFDVVKKFGHVPKEDISSFIDYALTKIKENNMAIELNTSGLFRVVKETFPSTEIVKKALLLEIPLTIGTDAHKPEDVNKGLKEGVELLNTIGVEEIATFDKRRRIMVPL